MRAWVGSGTRCHGNHHRDDQYGEVVVEGDFDGNASDAGGSEPEKPDKRVWGIDNEALEALKAKTCVPASP